MNKKIFEKLLLLLIIILSIFVVFMKPAERKYKINVFNNSGNGVLAEDFSNNLDKNYWNIADIQYYNSKNVNVKDGFLEIEAKNENNNGHKYTSGLINTKDKFEFLYGKIIFKAKPAIGKENQSAVWLFPAEDSLFPEIDTIRALSILNNQTWTGMHYLYFNLQQQQEPSNSLSQNDFSIYEIQWEKEKIRVYKDNKFLFETTKNVPDKKMYLIINLAIGENWTGNLENINLPSTFLLDYIIIIPEERIAI